MTTFELNPTTSLVRQGGEAVEVRTFFPATIDDVMFLSAVTVAPVEPVQGEIAEQARAFEARLTDDSQDEPADLRIPDDDFGS
jgi:hypothetical protein